MRATTQSRIIAAVAVTAMLNIASACSDSTGPDLREIPRPPDRGMAVVPSAATIEVGESVQLTAHLFTPTGHPQRIAASWSSGNESVATVSAGGEVLGLGAGYVVITARTQDKSSIATIRVLASKPGKPESNLQPNIEPARKG
jgi:uncharacterized protein YjdB